MRIAFAGTPAFSVPALHALHAAGHDVAVVFTQPDRPAGRGRHLTPSPVAEAAAALELTVEKPERFDASAQDRLRDAAVECLVVVAYGLILPQAALDIPPRGCLNIHASLLPRWRGAAPVQRAVAAGDTETGICIMQMDAGLDTGPVWRRAVLAIGADETAGALSARLARLGADEITAALDDIRDPQRHPQPQGEDGACYAHKLSKDEARVDWMQPAAGIVRRVRAFNPVPVAWTQCGDARLRIFRAEALEEPVAARPGTVLGADDAGVHVAAGDAAVLLRALQWPGKKVQPAYLLAERLLGQRLE